MSAAKKNQVPVLLRRTPHNRYSLPILAAALEHTQGSPRIHLLDDPAYLGDFSRIFERFIICYSFMTPDLEKIRQEIGSIRSRYGKSALLLAGGPHPSADPEGCLELGFDAVFVGESEFTLPRYIAQFLDDRDGVKECRIIRDDESAEILERFLPYSEKLGIGAPLELTRGCFFGCAFCQTREIFKRHVTHRSIASILRGVRNYLRHHRKKVFFISPNGLSYGATKAGQTNHVMMRELFEGIKGEGIQYIDVGYFPSEVRPDYVTPESLDLIRRYCSNGKIALGIQTGSDSLLRRIGRGHTVSQALHAASLVHEFKLMPHCDFIFGFPDESVDQMNESLQVMEEVIRKYGARIHAHYYLPLPGTALWKSCGEPEPLPGSVRKKLHLMKEWGRLDGWWERQEKLSSAIFRWKKKGYITV